MSDDLAQQLARTLAGHERSLGEVVDQRDAAEEALGQAFYLVTGRSPEWSNLFGHAEALDEIGDAVSLLKQAAARLADALALTRPKLDEEDAHALQVMLDSYHLRRGGDLKAVAAAMPLNNIEKRVANLIAGLALTRGGGEAEAWEIPLHHIRREGWSVAVHNDYRQDGEDHTFWLLTHPNGQWVKGEGLIDHAALAEALIKARAILALGGGSET